MVSLGREGVGRSEGKAWSEKGVRDAARAGTRLAPDLVAGRRSGLTGGMVNGAQSEDVSPSDARSDPTTRGILNTGWLAWLGRK